MSKTYFAFCPAQSAHNAGYRRAIPDPPPGGTHVFAFDIRIDISHWDDPLCLGRPKPQTDVILYFRHSFPSPALQRRLRDAQKEKAKNDITRKTLAFVQVESQATARNPAALRGLPGSWRNARERHGTSAAAYCRIMHTPNCLRPPTKKKKNKLAVPMHRSDARRSVQAPQRRWFAFLATAPPLQSVIECGARCRCSIQSNRAQPAARRAWQRRSAAAMETQAVSRN